MRWIRALVVSAAVSAVLFFIWHQYKGYITRSSGYTKSYSQSIQSLEEVGAASYEVMGAERSVPIGKIEAKVFVLHFWASWCAPCIEEFPSLISLAEDLKGVHILAVSLDESEVEYQAFLKSLKVKETKNFHLVRSTETEKIAEDFGISKLPESYIFDANKKLIRKVPNAEKWDREDVRAFFSYLLSQ